MNRFGQAARFAYSPELLVGYLDSLPRPEAYTDDHHGRIIRRWRRKINGVTFSAANKMLVAYGTDAGAFDDWCTARNTWPVIRDRT